MIVPAAQAIRRTSVSALADIAHLLELGEEPDVRLAHALDLLKTVIAYETCALVEMRDGAEHRLILRPQSTERARAAFRRRIMPLVRSVTEPDSDARTRLVQVWPHHLAVPLVGVDQVAGLLIVARSSAAFDEEDLGVVSIVAAQLAAYLTAHRHREEVVARAKRESEEKDHFLAMVSHELRTPIAAVVAWSAVLRDRLGKADRAHALETIDRNANVLVQMVEDLLDLSRVQNGSLRIDLRAVDARSILASTIDELQPVARKKGIHLEGELAEGLAPTLCDPHRLQQIVWNLLGNGIKFTPRGGRVKLRLEQHEGHARIQVSDTGTGIGSELLPHIFDRFRQGEGASALPREGLGLGLAIVRTLVELQGGTVRAESRGDGAGSAFTVTLPLTSDALPASRPPASLAAVDALENVSVLVVDDSPDLGDVIKFVLEREGAHVTVVESMTEALLAVERAKPDVLLSDLTLPDGTGWDLLEEIRKTAAWRSGAFAVAALSGRTSVEDRRRSLAAGFQAHLTKPITPAALIAAIAKLAGR